MSPTGTLTPGSLQLDGQERCQMFPGDDPAAAYLQIERFRLAPAH